MCDVSMSIVILFHLWKYPSFILNGNDLREDALLIDIKQLKYPFESTINENQSDSRKCTCYGSVFYSSYHFTMKLELIKKMYGPI